MKFKKVFLETTESTNLWLNKLYQTEKTTENRLVVTEYQLQGKGLDKNTWESEKGMNLLMSIGFKPDGVLPEQQFAISKMVSLCLVDALSVYLDPKTISIKWPNDIFINDKKLAGILITSSLLGNEIDYSIIGIGLNVNQISFSENLPNAISMKMKTGLDYNLKLLADEIVLSFEKRWNTLTNNILKVQLEQEYLSFLYRKGIWAEYIIFGKKQEAMIMGVNRYGHLELELKNGSKAVCELKEVVFV